MIVDMMNGQIRIPVKITLTETHLSCLKNRLPASVSGIEIVPHGAEAKDARTANTTHGTP